MREEEVDEVDSKEEKEEEEKLGRMRFKPSSVYAQWGKVGRHTCGNMYA